MGWEAKSVVDRRLAFCRLCALEGANVSQLCPRLRISRQTGYIWLKRVRSCEVSQDRHPHSSPRRTDRAVEQTVLELRDAHPAWGARKIACMPERSGIDPPAASTVHAILVGHKRNATSEGAAPASGRFAHEAPNLLWQMDFKGRFQLVSGDWCHPLTVLDDHSRFAVARWLPQASYMWKISR